MPSEFVVREDAAALVARHRLHVRQCYGVAVDLDDAAPVGGSRWVRLSGGDGSQRQRAKDYIVALCSPDSAAAAAGDRRDDAAAAAAAGDAGRTTAGEEEAGGAAPPGYESSYQLCLDFARKLGYSESQVRDAIGRLGGAPLHNTLLEELLKHGAAAPAPAEGAAAGGGGKARGAAASSAYDEGQERLSRVLVARGGGEPEPPADPTPPFDPDDSSNLRHIVIDGSNVAMSHGNKEVFSCRGIELAVSWFLQRGHKEVTVLVPTWRREQPRADAPITDQHILTELERRRVLVFTPSRRVQGRRVVCYDDRFIVRLAHESDGVIVSNDNYRDLQSERAEWRRFVEERLLMYSFVNDKFMLPDDPLGRDGPTLENFLRKVPVPTQNKRVPCPYGRKCTFGNKCKYSHPERANQIQLSVADELRAAAGQQQQQQLQQEVAGAAEGTSEGRGAPAGSPSRATARPHRKDAAPAEVQHQSGKPPAKPFPGHHHHQHQLPPTPTKAQQLQPSQLAVPQLQNQPAHGYHHHHQQQQQQQLQQQQQQQLQQQQTRTGTAAPVGAWGVLDWSEGGEECSQQDSGYNSLRTLSGASQDGAAMLPSVATGGGGGGGGGVAGVVYGAGCYSDPGIASDPSSGQYRQAQYYQHDAYAVQGPSKLPPHHPSHPPHPSRQQHHANRQQHLHPNQHHQQQQQHLHQHPHHGSHGAPFNPATAADGQLAATFPGGCGAYRPDLPYGAPCSCCVRFPAQKQQQQVQQVQQQQQLAPGPFISDSFLYDSGSSVPLPQPNSWHGPLGQPAAAYRSLYQQHPSHPPAHHHHHQQQQQQQQPYHNHQQQQQQRYQPRHYPPIAQPAPFQNAAVGAGGGGAGGGDDGVTEQLRAQVFRNLCGVFPQPVVDRVMAMHPHVTDSQELATYCVKMKALPPPPPAAAPMQPPRSY